MSRLLYLTVTAGIAAVLLAKSAIPVLGALSEEGLAPSTHSQSLMLAQAPAATPPNIETNIAQLRQRLGITPAQEPQFNTLANIMRENARMMPASPPSPSVSAVEGLRLAIQYGQQEIDGMRRMLPALQSLYAVLTPVQRQAADQVFRQGPGE